MAVTRRERKGIKAAAKLLPPDVEVRRYLSGRGRSGNTNTVMIIVAVFVVAFVVALALGYVIFPGGILLLVAVNSVRPPRGIAVTSNGVYVCSISMFNGRATQVVAHVPAASAWRSPDGKELHVGGETITLNRADRAKAAEVLAAAPSAAVVPAAWYPDPTGASHLRYWDGLRWTEHTSPGASGAAAQGQPV